MPAATMASTGRPVSTSPRNRTLPDAGVFSPVMPFMIVVFPAPFDPIRVAIRPAAHRQADVGDRADRAIADAQAADVQHRFTGHAAVPSVESSPR